MKTMAGAPMPVSKLLTIFAVGLLAAAVWHIVLVAEQIRLEILPALSCGLLVGLLIAAGGVLRKHPWWGLGLGAVACYLLTLGYVVFVKGIPLEWFY